MPQAGGDIMESRKGEIISSESPGKQRGAFEMSKDRRGELLMLEMREKIHQLQWREASLMDEMINKSVNKSSMKLN